MTQLKPDLDRAYVADSCWENIAKRLPLAAAGGDLGSRQLHGLRGDIGEALAAASARLGRAFGVGFDLATLCRLPADARLRGFRERFGMHAIAIQQALADLSSALPDHASRAVSLSLAVWQHWAADPQLSRRAALWPNASIGKALERQGEVWHAVLSGEKLGKDMLGMSDYAGALWSLVRRAASRWWLWLVGVLTIGAAAGGIYLLVAQGPAVKKVIGAALTGLAAVGLRLASLKQLLGDAAVELEGEIWGAELDLAIADAITVPPGDWRLSVRSRAIELPPARGVDPSYARHARTIHVLSRRSRGELHEPRSNRRVVRAIYSRWRAFYGKRLSKFTWLRARRLRQQLDDQCQYELAGALTASTVTKDRRVVTGKDRVALALADLGLPEYTELACEATGRLASRHGPDDRGVVWTFHRHKVRHIAVYVSYVDACTAAAQPWLDESEDGDSRATDESHH